MSIIAEMSNLPPNAPNVLTARQYSFLRSTLGQCRKSTFFQSGCCENRIEVPTSEATQTEQTGVKLPSMPRMCPSIPASRAPASPRSARTGPLPAPAPARAPATNCWYRPRNLVCGGGRVGLRRRFKAPISSEARVRIPSSASCSFEVTGPD